MKPIARLHRLLTLLALVGPFIASAGEVRIAGATTVFLTVVKEAREAVATETGATVVASGSTSGKGLAALHAGQVEVAMLTDRLANVAAATAAKGTPIAVDDYEEHFIKEAALVVVVHPSNPVASLSDTQVRDILTGQVKNWRDVGGADAPIAVFFEREDSGNHGLIKSSLLKDASLRSINLTFVDNARLIVRNVHDVHTGFGISASAYVSPAVKVVEGYRITQYLCFVTRKDASPDVMKVVEAFRARAK